MRPILYTRHVQTSPTTLQKNSHAVAISILLSPALLIIDHIHFQYNGFLYGILILSMISARKQPTMLLGGLLFAVLLCFKHIYLYLAPAYFVYLLRAYCLNQTSMFRIRFGNCTKLASGLIGIFGAAFGPFWYQGQMDQVLSRLFPFSRGLCHAYWAPNVWAMYSFTDRVLIYGQSVAARSGIPAIVLQSSVAPKLRLSVDQAALNSVTRGLVGDSSFAVLPNISPRATFILTLFVQLVGSQHPILYRWLTVTAMFDQTLLPADVGDLRRSCDFVRLRIFLIWMACPREGHPLGDHTVQLAGFKRPSVPWRVSTFGRCWARFSVPVIVHGCRVPSEGHIHGLLVDTIPSSV